MDKVPTPKADAKKIVGLVKSSGRITGYQLSDGERVSKEEGAAMAKAGEIQGVGVAHRKDSEYLKSLPDGSEDAYGERRDTEQALLAMCRHGKTPAK